MSDPRTEPREYPDVLTPLDGVSPYRPRTRQKDSADPLRHTALKNAMSQSHGASDGPTTPERRTVSSNPDSLSSLPTPHRRSSHDSEAAYALVEQIQDAMWVELEGVWVQETDGLPFQKFLADTADGEYPGLDGIILRWLEDYDGYDSEYNTWSNFPEKPEKALYAPLERILKAILVRFSQREREVQGKVVQRREVRQTHHIYLAHNKDDAMPMKNLKSEPDISIFATGPSIAEDVDIPRKPSYLRMGSIWEAKVEETLGKDEKSQLATYARETFIQQPHRRFVYVTMITGQNVRIFRFDRAGCYYSQPIDYHKNAVFFVKLVLLLSSFNEELLGFDTSVYWENGTRKLKMTPTKVFDRTLGEWVNNVNELLFDIDQKPMFARRTIRSRGTVCWTAEHHNEQYIVKDYWRADGRLRESDFLSKLAGIEGVGEMFTFLDDRESIQEGRGFTLDEDMIPDHKGAKDPVLNRFFMRVVVRKYDGTLTTAGSAVQLLCAVRDIIRGHRDGLLNAGILHRDISLNNLLLSHYSTQCGALIDWDLAKEIQELVNCQVTEGDARTGTRAYQSVKVLRGDIRLGHHDHMDDLESIFYVLYHVLFGHDAGGKALKDPGLIASWFTTADPVVLSHVKASFLTFTINQTLTRYTNVEMPILFNLMDALRQFFWGRISAIADATRLFGAVAFPVYSVAQAQEDYDRFLGHIDDALEKLSALRTASSVPSASTSLMPHTLQIPSASAHHSFTNSSPKRVRDEDHDDLAPPLKRPSPSPSTGATHRRTISQRGHSATSKELFDEENAGAGPSSASDRRESLRSHGAARSNSKT